jgi:hypothetical protein
MTEVGARAMTEAEVDALGTQLLRRTLVLLGPTGERWLPRDGRTNDQQPVGCVLNQLGRARGELEVALGGVEIAAEVNQAARDRLWAAARRRGYRNVMEFNDAQVEFGPVRDLLVEVIGQPG